MKSLFDGLEIVGGWCFNFPDCARNEDVRIFSFWRVDWTDYFDIKSEFL